MGIDVSKPAHLVRALSVLAIAGGLAGCGEAAATPTRIPAKPVVSRSCPIASEALRPPILDRESVATYNGGIVVNQAGSIGDLDIDIPALIRLNADPSLGLNSANAVKVTYFFAGSFSRPDAYAQAESFFTAHKFYLSARYCEEQGSQLDSVLRLYLSLGDIRDETITAYPSLKFGSPDWLKQFGRKIGRSYALGTRGVISPSLVTPLPNLPNQVIEQVLDGDNPFRVININSLPALTK